MLQAIQTAAARQQKSIRPLLSAQIDFYLRCFVTVHESASATKDAPSNVAMHHCCEVCESYQLQPLGELSTSDTGNPKHVAATCAVYGPHCPECGGKVVIGGPLWVKPLCVPTVLSTLLAAITGKDKELAGLSQGLSALDRIGALVRGLEGELSVTGLRGVMHMNLNRMQQCMNLPSVPLGTLYSALEAAGHSVSQSHTDPVAIKTSASVADLWDLLRCYAKHHNIERRAEPGKKKKKKRERLNNQNEEREGQLQQLWGMLARLPVVEGCMRCCQRKKS